MGPTDLSHFEALDTLGLLSMSAHSREELFKGLCNRVVDRNQDASSSLWETHGMVTHAEWRLLLLRLTRRYDTLLEGEPIWRYLEVLVPKLRRMLVAMSDVFEVRP